MAAAVVVVALGGPLVAGTAIASGATVPGQAIAHFHGEVNVTIWSIDSDGPDFQAILSGAIGDYGPAVTVLPDGKVDPEHTNEMELELRHGTFRLYIDGIASKFRAQTTHEPLYAATCSDYFHVTANVPVVAGFGDRCVPGYPRRLFVDPHRQRGPEEPTVRVGVRKPGPPADRLGNGLVLRPS